MPSGDRWFQLDDAAVAERRRHPTRRLQRSARQHAHHRDRRRAAPDGESGASSRRGLHRRAAGRDGTRAGGAADRRPRLLRTARRKDDRAESRGRDPRHRTIDGDCARRPLRHAPQHGWRERQQHSGRCAARGGSSDIGGRAADERRRAAVHRWGGAQSAVRSNGLRPVSPSVRRDRSGRRPGGDRVIGPVVARRIESTRHRRRRRISLDCGRSGGVLLPDRDRGSVRRRGDRLRRVQRRGNPRSQFRVPARIAHLPHRTRRASDGIARQRAASR